LIASLRKPDMIRKPELSANLGIYDEDVLIDDGRRGVQQ
jgi:hypothetical protein